MRQVHRRGAAGRGGVEDRSVAVENRQRRRRPRAEDQPRHPVAGREGRDRAQGASILLRTASLPRRGRTRRGLRSALFSLVADRVERAACRIIEQQPSDQRFACAGQNLDRLHRHQRADHPGQRPDHARLRRRPATCPRAVVRERGRYSADWAFRRRRRDAARAPSPNPSKRPTAPDTSVTPARSAASAAQYRVSILSEPSIIRS